MAAFKLAIFVKNIDIIDKIQPMFENLIKITIFKRKNQK